MALLKRDRIVEDAWTVVDDENPIPDSTPVVVSHDRWLAERESLARRNGGLGILLASDRSPDLIADDLDRFALVCLDFPKFTDGRAYSYARMLRAKYGYTGEVRAVGAVLRDQLIFMRRCGFDSFVIPDNVDTAKWIAAFNDFSVRYQPMVDRLPTTLQLRKDGAIAGLALGPRGASDSAGSWSY